MDAFAFVEMARSEISAMTLDELHDKEPWLWCDRYNARIEDDNGEDYTAVFPDGSRAMWINCDLNWELLV